MFVRESYCCMQNEHPDRLDDARMPLDLPCSSGSTQQADSLKDSSGNNLRTADRRRSSSYGRVSPDWNMALAGS